MSGFRRLLMSISGGSVPYAQPQIYDYGTWGSDNTLSVKTNKGDLNTDHRLWYAFNEEYECGWHSAYNSGGVYFIDMSLGESVKINKIRIVNRSSDPNNVFPARAGKLYGSNDGVNFTDVIAVWTNDVVSAGGEWEFTVDDTNSYKFLRLEVNRASRYLAIKRIYIDGILG